jgi:hypothetical protein
VDGTKKCPKQPPLVWFPPLVLSASAYSVSVLRPPTSRSATWDSLNNTTCVNNLSNFRSRALKWTLVDTYMTSKYIFSYN